MSVKRRGGRREEHRVRIVSEGTPPTTRVYVGGYLLSGVKAVQWSLDANDTWPTVVLYVTDAEVDALANLEDGGKVIVDVLDTQCTAKDGFNQRCIMHKNHPRSDGHVTMQPGTEEFVRW